LAGPVEVVEVVEVERREVDRPGVVFYKPTRNPA
jgi:hypothetical protein